MADSMRGINELKAALKDMSEIAILSTEGSAENIHFVAAIQCLGWQLGEEPYASQFDTLLQAIRKELKRIVHQKSHGIREVPGRPDLKTLPHGFDMRDYESDERKRNNEQEGDRK